MRFRQSKEIINTETVDIILEKSNKILLIGPGGAGKTMLMRYLFLKTAEHMNYIPIYLQLKKTNDLSEEESKEEVCIANLILKELDSFDFRIKEDGTGKKLEQLEYALSYGKFLVLLDGFDEVVSKKLETTAAAIAYFCKKYAKNPVIVSSRIDMTYWLEEFTKMNTKPLSKDEAKDISRKFESAEKDEIESFINKLDAEWFEEYKDFATNPLLLSIMYLTYIGKGSIPNHLVDFYDQAYDTLFSRHDLKNKQGYHRVFKSGNIDKYDFGKIFSYFCFHSLYNEMYDFPENSIKNRIRESIGHECQLKICESAYLDDLVVNVCMMLKDGMSYYFCHRDFQAYFAACYLRRLGDEKQKIFYKSALKKSGISFALYKIMAQMEEERFLINCLQPALHTTIDSKFSEWYVFKDENGTGQLKVSMRNRIYYDGATKEIVRGMNQAVNTFNILLMCVKPENLNKGKIKVGSNTIELPSNQKRIHYRSLDPKRIAALWLSNYEKEESRVRTDVDPVDTF